jgi:hypothetical protein
MVRFVDPSPSPAEGKVGYDPSPAPAVKALRFGTATLKWRAFLAGPRLQSGLALAILVVVSLIFWVGLLAAILLILRHI